MEFIIFASSYFFSCFRLRFSPSLLALLNMNLERKGNLFFHMLYLSKFDTTFGRRDEDENHSKVVYGASWDE